MLVGPCCCGATHLKGDMVRRNGLIINAGAESRKCDTITRGFIVDGMDRRELQNENSYVRRRRLAILDILMELEKRIVGGAVVKFTVTEKAASVAGQPGALHHIISLEFHK